MRLIRWEVGVMLMGCVPLSGCGTDMRVDGTPSHSATKKPVVAADVGAGVDLSEIRREAGDLTITVGPIQTQAGSVCYAMIAESQKQWFAKADIPAEAIYSAACVQASGDSVRFEVKAVAFGRYALSIFHDVNGNGLMDKKSLLGIPVEPFGFSNNPSIGFGAPSFEACAFVLNGTSFNADVKLVSLF
jgi:uncharacterized protein (DUF2141 family)